MSYSDGEGVESPLAWTRKELEKMSYASTTFTCELSWFLPGHTRTRLCSETKRNSVASLNV